MATLEELQARRAAYVAQELKILGTAQEYQIGSNGNGRRLVRPELEQIRIAIKELDEQIDKLQAQASGARRVYRIVPGCR